MNLKNVFYGVLTLALLFFGWKAYRYVQDLQNANARLHLDLVNQTQAYQQLSAKAAKLAIQYADVDAMKAELAKNFAAEKDALEGRIKILSNATFTIREKARDSKGSDISYQGEGTKYVVNEIRFNDGPPVGYVLIFDDGRVVSKMYNHTFEVKTAVSRDEDSGRYAIVSKAAYTLKSPSINTNGEQVWTNKPYALNITGGTATIDPTEKNQLAPKMQWWAPHVNGGLSFGAGGAGAFFRPSLDLSLAGFGPTKNDLDWKFVHIGIDSDSEFKDPGAHFLPFSYRFFPSLLSNTYAGPGIGWSTKGFNFQLNLNLTF